MTVIIGYGTSDGKSHIASDSKCSNDTVGQFYKNKKVFTKGEVLVGVAGSVRQAQLVYHNFEPPFLNDWRKDNVRSYMYKKFLPAITKFLVDNYCIKEDEGLENPDADYVFVVHGLVFRMESSALLEPETPFICAGEGADYAHAVLTTLESTAPDLAIKARLEMAVHLTSQYILSVGGKAVVLSK